MSAPPRSKITMQMWIATAVNMPAESPTFDTSLTYLFYFLHPCQFSTAIYATNYCIFAH